MPVIATNTTAQNAANANASKVSFNTTTHASNAVNKVSVQNNTSVQPTSTTSNDVQETSHNANAVIPQKSTPSDISAPNQQAVGQIAEKGDLTLNRDTNQSVSLNANGQRVLTVRGVDNVTQKNGQTTVYSYDNGQVHQFDKNLNMTSGPSDHTVLQNDGKGAIYISDGKPYQAQAYPEGYTRLTKTVNGLELQKVPTRTVNTFTQDGKTNCVFPGRGISESVSSYKVNDDESVTVTLANGTQETLQNNWVKPVPTAISNNLNVEKKSDNDRDDLLAQAAKTDNNQGNGNVLESGAGYQVVQKGSSIAVNYNSKQVVAYNNVTNLKKDTNGLTFNANNGGLYITLGKPKSNSLGNQLPFNQSETEQALLNDTKKNSDVLYLGKNNTGFSSLEGTRYFQTIEKRGNQYFYTQRGTGVGGAYTGNKGTGVDNGGEAETEITNVKFAPNGDVTFTEVHGGKTMTLTNNWLKSNNASNNTKPSTTNSSPEAVSLVGVKAIYQDAAGKQIGSWNGSVNQDPVKTAESHLPAGYTFDKVISSKESTQTSMSNGEQMTSKIYNVVIQVKSNATTNSNNGSSNNTISSANKGPSTSSSNGSANGSSSSPSTGISGMTPTTSGNKGTNIGMNSSNNSTNSSNSSSDSSSANQPLPDVTSAESHASDNHETDETGNGPQSPASQSNTANTSAQGSTTTPESQSKPANSSNPSASTSANGENGSSAMAGGNSTTPGKTASDVNNGSSNKVGQSQAQSQNGSKTTVSDNGNVKTESSSNSGTADSIAALEKKTSLPAAEIKKMLAIAEANGGRAQFQNEQQHVYHVGSQGQAVAEPAGSAASAPVEEASTPAQSADVASISAGSVSSSVAALASASATQSKPSASSVNTSNALPETGMANEGIEFAAAMLALAGIAMVKREHEE